MASLAAALLDLREFDRLALQETPIHRLDPRAKTLTTAIYLAVLATFGRYDVAALLPLALFPVALAALGGVPAGLMARKALLSLPFILVLGAFLPFLERRPLLYLGPVIFSEGWIAYASLLLRGILAVTTAITLVAVTGVGDLGAALHRLGLPRPFVQQMLFLYRYLFLVGAETQRRLLARSLRAHGRGLTLAEFPAFGGHLLLRSWERAERVHAALLARGFRGTLPGRAAVHFGARAWGFLLGWSAFFLICRMLPLASMLGGFAGGGP